jgi:hypothetical protein
MKISIPNIFVTVFYFTLLFSAAFILVNYQKIFIEFEKQFGVLIFIFLIHLISIYLLIKFSINFKLIIITNESICILKPFKLEWRKINYDKIKNIYWSNIIHYRIGSIIVLNIEIEQSIKPLKFTNFEYLNFQAIENKLTSLKNISFNKRNRELVKTENAKENWIYYSVFFLTSISIFIILFKNDNYEYLKFIIQVLALIFSIQLLFILFRYYEILSKITRKKE